MMMEPVILTKEKDREKFCNVVGAGTAYVYKYGMYIVLTYLQRRKICSFNQSVGASGRNGDMRGLRAAKRKDGEQSSGKKVLTVADLQTPARHSLSKEE